MAIRKSRTRPGATRTRKKPIPSSGGSGEVTVDNVIDDLYGLFEHLGLDISRKVSSVKDKNATANCAAPLYPYASAIGELLTSWHQDPTYLDDSGNPAPLKRFGRRPSFRSLARRTVPDIDASYLLSELKRLGAVTIDEASMIRVHMRSLPAYEDKRLAVQHTLTSLDGFIRTLRHNLDSTPSNSDQLFHRIAQIDDFDSRELPALKIKVKRHGQRFLESFDNWLTRKASSRSGRGHRQTEHARVAIGVYLSVDTKQ